MMFAIRSAALFKPLMPQESMVDNNQETVGLGQTPVTNRKRSDRPLDRDKAFDASARAVVRIGEWKPNGAPTDSFRAMHEGKCDRGRSQMKTGSYAFGAEFVESGSTDGPTKSAFRFSCFSAAIS